MENRDRSATIATLLTPTDISRRLPGNAMQGHMLEIGLNKPEADKSQLPQILRIKISGEFLEEDNICSCKVDIVGNNADEPLGTMTLKLELNSTGTKYNAWFEL